MDSFIKTIIDQAASLGFFDRIAAVYGEMDRQWDAVAGHYRFACHGCAENCCLTLFHHHCWLEFLYLADGFRNLPETSRDAIRKRAAGYESDLAAFQEDAPFRRLCPLNEDGGCLLYSRRPMICRLHGIPHEMTLPGGRRVLAGGCHDFDRQCGGPHDMRLDRTPLYRRMADLEQSFRQATGIAHKFKQRVAQMLLAHPQG